MKWAITRELKRRFARHAKLCAASGWQVQPEQVQPALAEIVAFYAPERIYLFGSFARGDFTEHSDLDLMIVVPDEAQGERLGGLRARKAWRGSGWDVDCLVNTTSRFEAGANSLSMIQAAIAEEGKVIYKC